MEMNMQDGFLNRMWRSGQTSIVRLIDGTECEGLPVVSDPLTIVMLVDGTETLIFKQNVIIVFQPTAANAGHRAGRCISNRIREMEAGP